VKPSSCLVVFILNTKTHNSTKRNLVETILTQRFCRSLYNSALFDNGEMQHILNELNGMMCNESCIILITELDVTIAINKLNAQNDGNNNGLSTHHLIDSGPDLTQQI